MPSPVPQVATGITVTFSTSSFAANIVDIDLPEIKRDAIDSTHQGTSGDKTFIPGLLRENGELGLKIQHDPSITPPMGTTNTAENITIQFPMLSGKTTAAKQQFTGFMTKYKPTAKLEKLMEADCTIKVTGAIAVTTAA